MFTRLAIVGLIFLSLGSGLVRADGLTPTPISIDPVPPVAILKATTNAPAAASGIATLGGPLLLFGTNSPDLNVWVEGLPGGVYTVDISDNASNNYTLGTFTVPTFTNHNFAAIAAWTNVLMVIPVGGGNFALPDGLNASNVVGVAVADSNAVVNLTGTFNSPVNPYHHEFQEDILLMPTNSALPGSSGRAELDEDDHVATNLAAVTVEANGLAVGSYTVSLTDQTGTNLYVLGTLEMNIVTNPPGFAQPQFRILGGTNSAGRAEFPLPAELNPTNVATIYVANTDDVVNLIGDFQEPTNTQHCRYSSVGVLIPGPVCTNLQGSASLQLTATKGRTHGTFSLVAQNAPANQKLTLLVNGVSVGTVKSNKRGQVKLNSLPHGVDLENVLTLEADDSSGNAVFNVTF